MSSVVTLTIVLSVYMESIIDRIKKNNKKYQTTEVEKNIKENSQIIIDELKAAIKLKQ